MAQISNVPPPPPLVNTVMSKRKALILFVATILFVVAVCATIFALVAVTVAAYSPSAILAQGAGWSSSWTTTSPVEGANATVSVSNPDVDDAEQIFTTLHVGRDEGTADTADIIVRGANGSVRSPQSWDPTSHHNGGWAYTNQFHPASDARAGTFVIEVVDDEDEDETLAVWVYVNGELAGSQTLTLSPKPDTITLDFRDTTLSVDEGGSVTVTVDADFPFPEDVEIPLTVTHQGATTGDDYTGVTDALTLPANTTTASLTVEAVDDTHDDDDESLTIAFGTLPECCIAGTTTSVSIAIQDNDEPGEVIAVVVSFKADSYSVAESDDATTTEIKENEATITVVTDVAVDQALTIPIARINIFGAVDDDYSGVPNEVVFDPNTTEVSFTFMATDDSDDDDGERIRLGFGTLPTGVTAGTISQTTVSIADDDDGGLTILPPSNLARGIRMKFPDGSAELIYETQVASGADVGEIITYGFRIILPGTSTTTDMADGFLSVSRPQAFAFVFSPAEEITPAQFRRAYGGAYGGDATIVMTAAATGDKTGRITIPVTFYYDASAYFTDAVRDNDWLFTPNNTIELYEGGRLVQVPWTAHQSGTRAWGLGNPSEVINCKSAVPGGDTVLSAWPDAGNEDSDAFVIVAADSQSSGNTGPTDLYFKAVLDYENPLDSDGDNTYVMRVHNTHVVHGSSKPSCGGSAVDMTIIVKDLGVPLDIVGLEGILPWDGNADQMAFSWNHTTHYWDGEGSNEVPVVQGALIQYEYRFRPAGATEWGAVDSLSNVGSRALVIIEDIDGDSYDVQVRAVSIEGPAAWPSDWVVVSRTEAVPIEANFAGGAPRFPQRHIHASLLGNLGGRGRHHQVRTQICRN